MGKKWFEEEIAYQIYEDGTFLQHSMNYHRIVVQLLTWGITLAERKQVFDAIVYKQAASSLLFLRACMVKENGWLPNYGANDGALFFKLSNVHFRDYRPQLQALAAASAPWIFLVDACEDVQWYGIEKEAEIIRIEQDTYSFPKGG